MIFWLVTLINQTMFTKIDESGMWFLQFMSFIELLLELVVVCAGIAALTWSLVEKRTKS